MTITNLTAFETLLQEIWAGMEQGVTDSHHAFHTPVLGNLSERGVSLRTVVLRKAQPDLRTLICHTDVRSDKVAELRKNSSVSFLFYSPEDKIQIRAEGSVKVYYQDEIAQEGWQSALLSSRRAYTALAGPGTPIDEPESGLPDFLIGRSPTLEESEAGWPNFAVIVSTIERFDWLYLEAKGHRRAQFSWNGTGFDATWVIP